MLLKAMQKNGLYRVQVNNVGEILQVQRDGRTLRARPHSTFTVRVRVGRPPLFGHFNNLDATQADIIGLVKKDIDRIHASEDEAHVIAAKQKELDEAVAGGDVESPDARRLKSELVVRLAMAGEKSAGNLPAKLKNLRSRFGELPPSQTRLAEEQEAAKRAEAAAALFERDTAVAEAAAAPTFEELLAQEKADARRGDHGALPVKNNLFYGEKLLEPQQEKPAGSKRQQKRARQKRKKAAAKLAAQQLQAQQAAAAKQAIADNDVVGAADGGGGGSGGGGGGGGGDDSGGGGGGNKSSEEDGATTPVGTAPAAAVAEAAPPVPPVAPSAPQPPPAPPAARKAVVKPVQQESDEAAASLLAALQQQQDVAPERPAPAVGKATANAKAKAAAKAPPAAPSSPASPSHPRAKLHSFQKGFLHRSPPLSLDDQQGVVDDLLRAVREG